ncbi:hypothetical protein [Hymenobacter chitinivorans]|uniref:hypothetical protein n=1 Tax=Hymenobacter chitinivorans TaxID=89969 RepID=UPI000C233048|nr:hypothetical protein [Hymenobacter chitinivorans]
MGVTIRKNDVKASNLLLVSLVLGTVGQAVQFTPAFSSRFFGTLVFMIFNLLPGLAFAWLIRQGYHWAKIFFLFLVIVGVFFYLPKLLEQKDPFTILVIGACAVPQVWMVFILLRDLLRKPESPDAGAARGGRN